MQDSAFLNLPAELRLRIYEYTLQFARNLHRPLRASAWRKFTGYLARGTALLSTCRLVHSEAIDVLYELNSFRISYHHMCTCENKLPFPAFDEQRIRRLEVSNLLPQVKETGCQFCVYAGSTLISYLRQLPKLQSARVAFKDFFRFSLFAGLIVRRLREEPCEIELLSDEVGHVRVCGLHIDLELRLPKLHRTWLLSARRVAKSDIDDLPGMETMRNTLTYLQVEANTYDRTVDVLLPFFVRTEKDRVLSLRFHELPNEKQQRADFTFALARVSYDMYVDGGGPESLNWVQIGSAPSGRTWTFEEDGIAADGNRSRQLGFA